MTSAIGTFKGARICSMHKNVSISEFTKHHGLLLFKGPGKITPEEGIVT